MPYQTTSWLSYQEVILNLGERQKQVLNALKELGEANNLMISKKVGLPINSITGRVRELRGKRLILKSKEDLCPYTKRRTIWWRINLR